MNKRGADFDLYKMPQYVFWVILGVIVAFMIGGDWYSDKFDLLPGPENFQKPSLGFEYVLSTSTGEAAYFDEGI